MVREISILLGAGLGILGVVGLTHHADPWLVWLDLGVAIVSFLTAFLVSSRARQGLRIAVPLIFAGVMYSIWQTAIAVQATGWLSMWNFGIGSLFLLLGFAAMDERTRAFSVRSRGGRSRVEQIEGSPHPTRKAA
jgi:hypothetical protein